MENEIKKLEEDLKNMSGLISEDKKKEQLAEGQKKMQDYYQFKEKIWGDRGEYYQENKKRIEPIIRQINECIKSASMREEYDFVLDANTGFLLFAQQNYDITDNILNELTTKQKRPFKEITNTLNIVSINTEKLMSDNPNAVKAKADLIKWNKLKEAEAAKMENEIKKLEDDLKNLSMLMSEEKKKDKLAEGQKKMQDYYRFKEKVWGQGGEYYKENQKLMEPIIKNINETIKLISEKNGYDYVFDYSEGTLLFSDQLNDISDKILYELQH